MYTLMKLRQFRRADVLARTAMNQYEIEVARLFRAVPGSRGDICEFPIIGGHFLKGEKTLWQRALAAKALEARDWFAVNGPHDAPPLPLSYSDREVMKIGGLSHMMALYARSLEALEYDTDHHPSFEEYARGVIEWDPNWATEALRKRFPPRRLEGLDDWLCWHPPGDRWDGMRKRVH
jgi:hypothetical protein